MTASTVTPLMRISVVSIVDEESSNQDLWLLDVARGLRDRFTFEEAADFLPVWSPDGSVVAYSSLDQAGNPVIRTVEPLSGDEPRFVVRGLEPSFSPKGDWLVYTAKRRGRWAIWRARSPSEALIAEVSLESLAGVLVPWAFT